LSRLARRRGRSGADGECRHSDQAEQDRWDSPLDFDLHVGGVRSRLAAQARLASERLQRGRACLLGVEREPALVECLEVERLAPGEGGIVCERDELAADDGGGRGSGLGVGAPGG
jgi:hypothetical protein